MTAMERIAWTELLVSLAAVGVVAALYPWLGAGATGGFALLGLVGFTVFFVRPRAGRVTVDERDREIEATAIRLGVTCGWMTLMLALVAAVVSSSYYERPAVPIAFLNWLIWMQFALCIAVKGLASVVLYRRQRHAA